VYQDTLNFLVSESLKTKEFDHSLGLCYEMTISRCFLQINFKTNNIITVYKPKIIRKILGTWQCLAQLPHWVGSYIQNSSQFISIYIACTTMALSIDYFISNQVQKCKPILLLHLFLSFHLCTLQKMTYFVLTQFCLSIWDFANPII